MALGEGPDVEPAMVCAGAAGAALTMAQRFTAGAALWCLAPRWPEHARHVAVEFVHPVVMGARALPATAVTGPDHVDLLRSMTTPGDLLLAVGTADDPVILDVLRRAPAWGATTIWCGTGTAPEHSGADHLVWLDEPVDRAPYDGRLALLYHLLWELTQVCFEHPGLMRDRAADAAGHCTTCADEGRVAEVVAVAAGGGDAQVRTAQGVERVDVTLVGPVAPDDLVLVHAGTAIGMVT